jgi:hypothetical protein
MNILSTRVTMGMTRGRRMGDDLYIGHSRHRADSDCKDRKRCKHIPRHARSAAAAKRPLRLRRHAAARTLVQLPNRLHSPRRHQPQADDSHPAHGRNGSGLLHQPLNSVYLVNSLVPADPDIRIISQNRNPRQSFYQLDYVQVGSLADSQPSNWWATVHTWKGESGFASLFPLGMRHIAEGIGHLLFFLALLLPAPLIAIDSRWAGPADVRTSLLRILKIVTAFTIGHSFTLALAAMAVIHVPAVPSRC